jgi:hypothetical protein
VSGVKHPVCFCVPDPERQSIIVKMYKARSTMACQLQIHGYFAPASFEQSRAHVTKAQPCRATK